MSRAPDGHQGPDTALNDSDRRHEPEHIQLAPLDPEALQHIVKSGKLKEAVQDGIVTQHTLTQIENDESLNKIVDHETLKYHLLGPSLTKAGQDSVDQRKVSQIIYDASKGSKFFNNEEVKDRNLTEKINRILARKRQLDKLDLSHDLRRADEYITSLEVSRDLSQTLVHIDCDAFYAAVEELDRPELRDVPMAVGKGVLTTCNYHARKFGCRSGMAGFVAMKLCPQLICLPLNFDKYIAKAEQVRAVLAEYDPRFQSASLDEAYLNITEYCNEHHRDPQEVVAQIRAEVHEKSKITVSAGIAANAMLAKIGSNRNKPNGQFHLASDRAAIMAFMRDLPTRKVNGIGRVFERELDALGIKTCGDIYPHRGSLARLFGDKAFEFLISVYLGLGRTSVRPAEEYERKSVGTESTFRDMSDATELRAKLRWIAEELEKDMSRTGFKGRTLVLKVKLHTYEVLTRQYAPPMAVCKADDLYRYGLPILEKLMREIDGFTLRLMGLRCTHLVSTKKGDVEEFFGLKGKQGSARPAANTTSTTDDDAQWEQWPASEFEDAARLERQQEMDDAAALSQEYERHHSQHSGDTQSPRRHHGREILSNPVPSSRQHTQPPAAVVEEWKCPICERPQPPSNRDFNSHIDYCLSKQTIEQAVKETAEQPGDASGAPSGVLAPSASSSNSRKRGRPPGKDPARGNKKLFFA